MLKKRIIFTLLSSDEYFMLSRNFTLQKVGNLDWIKKNYNFNLISESIDELIVLNVNRTEKKIKSFSEVVEKLAHNCFVPISAGGGIRCMDDARILLNSGADKLVFNSAFFFNKHLIHEVSNTFGNQCLVCSIDYKIENGEINIYTSNGENKVNITLREAIKNAHSNGAGEIYLTCMNKDGTGQGLDINTLTELIGYTNLPIIASGGVGISNHIVEGLKLKNIDSVSTANLFNFMCDGLIETREEIINSGINLATW